VTLIAFVCCFSCAIPIFAQKSAPNGASNGAQNIARLDAQYQAESDPVHKAKLLAKLGPQEMEAARQELKSDADQEALTGVRHYRDQVHETWQALNATGVDAERHPGGFRELQISLRETLRRLDDIIAASPFELQMDFRSAQSDLLDAEHDLFQELFPSPSNRAAKKAKSH